MTEALNLMKKHIKNKHYLWAQIMKAKIENKYNVKIVFNK